MVYQKDSFCSPVAKVQITAKTGHQCMVERTASLVTYVADISQHVANERDGWVALDLFYYRIETPFEINDFKLFFKSLSHSKDTPSNRAMRTMKGTML